MFHENHQFKYALKHIFQNNLSEMYSNVATAYKIFLIAQ